MINDKIETLKHQLNKYLMDNNIENKFTIFFNGEFLIANLHIKALDDSFELCDLPDYIANYAFEKNKIIFKLSNAWLKKSIGEIKECEYKNNDIEIYSQIKRLEKQIQYNLTGGTWTSEMYILSKFILYFLHTKSKSIRTNIVKRCKILYNELQAKTIIPENLVLGYKNALTAISNK